jgi:hypothetical protein
MDALSTHTQETDLKPQNASLGAPVFSESAEWKSALVELDPSGSTQANPESHVKAKVTTDPHLQAADLLYLAFAKTFGELPYPAYILRWQLEMVEDPTKPKHTELQYVRSIVQRALLREGESVSHSLKWWSRISISAVLLASLTSVLMLMPFQPGLGLRRWFGMDGGVLTPIYLVVVSSLVCLVQRLAWYGWRRCLRLLWVYAFPNPFKKRWRETVRTSGDYNTTKKDQF